MKKLLNFRLPLFIAVSLCFGIVFAYCYICGFIAVGVAIIALFISCVFLYLFLFTKKGNRRKALAFSVVFLLFFAIGYGTFYANVSRFRSADLGNHYHLVVGKITEENVTDYGNKYILSDVWIDGSVTGRLRYKVEVYVYGDADYQLGDYVEFKSHLIDKSLFYDGRFSAYAIEDGVKYSAKINSSDLTFVKSSPDLFQRTNLLIKKNLKAGLSEDSFAVAYALLTGNSDYIDLDTLTSYRQAGVAHIFAVSGLHIGFMATVMNFLLKKLKRYGFLKAIITTLVLLFYSGVCGFSSSSVRATIMCAVMSFITSSGQKYDGVSSWSIAGIIILLISPVELFCSGFQLSFTVVAGILLLQKPLARLFKFLPKKIADALSTVLSAQIFGAPVCLMTFGKTSSVAIILNLVFIPVVSIVFTATLVAVLFCAIFGLNSIVFFPLEYVYRAINFLITLFDYDIFMIGGFLIGVFVVVYYLAVVVASGFVNVKRVAKAISSISLALVFVVGTVGYNVYESNRFYMIISGSETASFTIIDSPESTVMIVSGATEYYTTSRIKRIPTYDRIKRIDKLIISSGCKVDIVSFTGTMRTVFEFGDIIYYGERDESMETVFLKSYPDYRIFSFVDGEEILGEKRLKISYAHGGKVVDAVVNEKKIGLFSDFESGEIRYSELSNDYSMAVFGKDGDIIYNVIKPQRAYSFRAGGWLNDAESGGNVRLLIE